jgi:arylformamidase
MSQIIDISWPISASMTSYKNNNPVTITHNKTFERDGLRDSALHLNSHTGTHVDAPSHFLEGGNSIDQYSLDSLVGCTVVIDMSHIEGGITDQDLHGHVVNPGEIVLLKTKNSQLEPTTQFDVNFAYLAPSAAALLVQHGVKAVGIDYLSIERNSPNHETHSALLSKNIPIIEGLRLGHVTPGRYQFYCLPLASVGLEAAPARAILVKTS